MTKNEIRLDMKAKRDAYPMLDKIVADVIICKILYRHIWLNYTGSDKSERPVCLYMSTGSEVDLDALIIKLIKEGYKVAVPATSKDKSMEFYLINSISELKLSSYGIREPEKTLEYIKPRNCCIYVPGLAFDKRGYRIGYGAGFYDRYLERYPNNNCYGVCYGFQKIKNCMPDEYDIRMKGVISDEN